MADAVAAFVVDFDGTACSVDVAEVLLDRFADDDWRALHGPFDAGRLGLRAMMRKEAAMLRGSSDELIAYAVQHCPLDPTFAPFVAWCEERGVPLTLASDGFAFYIAPILEATGLGHLDVITNAWSWNGERLSHPNGHPGCVGCGTCKMLAVQRHRAAHGAVAFVGEGVSDRYGALYADVVFAKDALVEICRRDGVPFLPWNDFGDVRRAIEEMQRPPGSVQPAVCPGWRRAWSSPRV